MENIIKIEDFDKIDKVKLTLTKSGWLSPVEEDTVLTITKDLLAIEYTQKRMVKDTEDTLCKMSKKWVFEIDTTMFKLVISAITESSTFTINMCDAIPAHVKCFTNNKKIFECNFMEDNYYFKEFISLAVPVQYQQEIFNEEIL